MHNVYMCVFLLNCNIILQKKRKKREENFGSTIEVREIVRKQKSESRKERKKNLGKNPKS